MRPKTFTLEIFLASLAGLLLEISYTRVLSFKISSYYTYLIIGLALLGIGAGGAFVAVSRRLRERPPERLLPGVCWLGGAAIGLGYFVIVSVELGTFETPSGLSQIGRLALVSFALFASFLPIGLLIAIVFAHRPESIHRLYRADLVGAGVGCAAAIPLMLAISPPGCVFASGALVALAGLYTSWGGTRRWAPVGMATAIALGLGAVFADSLPDPVVDPIKTMSPKKMQRWGFTHVLRRWHPVFRIDVLESALTPGRKALIHDGAWGSALYEFDGDVSSLAQRYDTSSRRLPFAVIRDHPRVLILGAAGGNEILASLYFGADRITAVELNPVTVDLLRHEFLEYTGRIAQHPKVELIHAEGRSFLGRDESKYDLIYFVAPDSYASMSAAQASGFVLVESYLYTVEMVREALRHLRPGGVICMQFGEVEYTWKPNRTARYLSTARRAFEDLGFGEFGRQVLVATSRDFPIELSTIVLGERPFSRDQVKAFLRVVESIPSGELRYARGESFKPSIPGRVISLPRGELEHLYRTYAYNVRPVSDDAPFFWHFARFRDVIFGRNQALRYPIGPEDGRGETALLMMLLISTGLAVVILLSPFALVRDRWSELPRKAPVAVYFAALGLGFMFFEIALIQKLTLLLGYPTYTLTVTLFALLVFSGIGSGVAERYVERRDRTLIALVVGVIALTTFYQFGMDPCVQWLVGRPLPLRIAFAVLVLAPLGMSLGAFMPLGLTTISRLTEYRAEYVAWGWAVNGVFSVFGAILATMLSMSFGFRAVLFFAAVLYIAAASVLRRVPLRPNRNRA